MEQNRNHIDSLIAKIISGNANSDDNSKLEIWEKESSENGQLVQKSRNVWNSANFYLPDKDFQSDKFKLSQAYNHHLSKQILRVKRRTNYYKLAAILAFPIALAFGWYISNVAGNLKNAPVQLTQVTSPKGHVSKSILPDGTEVWINTGSTITYDNSSFNKNTREINLEGEAYFEVFVNKDKPFKVNTPVATVNVTGTAFNVLAYPDENNFETVLAEGSIFLQFTHDADSSIAIKPGERLVYDQLTGSLSVGEVDAAMFTSWRNGELLFKDATLNDLITELERIYDIKFHLEPQELGEFRFRGMFSYNNNLIEALEKINRTSGIDYYIENKEVWLRNKKHNTTRINQ